MPTLHQLHLSTSTREKLTGKRPPPNNDAFVPIQTPSALLSRDPHQLSRALNVSLRNLKCIRAGVAEALIADPCTGHLDGCLPPHFRGNANNDDDGDDGRQRQFVVGSISAWQMIALAHSSYVKSAELQSLLTGSEALDQLLSVENITHPFGMISNPNASGGISFGRITQISGPPSSGKTQVCLTVASDAVMKNWNVVYLTCGNVRALSRRLFTLCTERGRCLSDGETQLATALERVTLSSISDAYALLSLLAKLESQCDTSTLLVIDSISGMIGHHLSSLTTGAALLNQVGLTLRRLACLDGRTTQESSLRFAVLTSNGSVASGGENKPAMGRYWHFSDVSLWLEQERDVQDNNEDVAGLYRKKRVVKATLLHHWAKRDGFVKFVLRSGGVADVTL